jgi:hypothetical protein
MLQFMSVRRAVMPMVLTVLAVTGCDSVDQRGDAAASIATRMLSAVGAGDGAGACAVLASDTASQLEESGGKPCAQAILDEELPAPGTVIGSGVYGQWAQVRLTGDVVFLAAFPGGWRVVAAGCSPQGNRPYDCTLQGS